ncbi:CLUMA_CG004746, isoform A [Clunio marinus]|uniref:BOS complex subunit TMEM147 n=1 Tax=Clunio marinus TaxID=568069 RepID=A0A1J1HU23_9DIPT|nr:CLUMA_CG004746, isoform A [Clunio marinus]
MTLFHFGNVVALAVLPIYFLYKFSGLSEYGLTKIFHAGSIYVFTQLCKMLILTFFPETINTDPADFNFLGECLRCSADLLDFVGLAFVLSKIPGKSHSKLLTAAVGWSSAEIILSKGLILWRARGAEFSWIYTQKSLESNILLVVTCTVTCLLWLFSRHDLNRKHAPIVTFLLLAIAFKAVWLDGTLLVMGIGTWTCLAIKMAVSIFCFGLPTLYLYANMAQTIGI